uniref:Uncharacterized protein n=1 Tax=Tetranychus urticae TaxID=32264 RepID=T1JXB5_TETUR
MFTIHPFLEIANLVSIFFPSC